MVHAFVMLGMIREFPPVSEAHIVAGEYDIIVELSVDEVYDVLQTTASDIQSLDGVLETKTYISLED